MAVCFLAPPLRNRARASVTIFPELAVSLCRHAEDTRRRGRRGKGVVITARGREDMAPLYTTVAYARRLAQNPGGAQPAHIGGAACSEAK